MTFKPVLLCLLCVSIDINICHYYTKGIYFVFLGLKPWLFVDNYTAFGSITTLLAHITSPTPSPFYFQKQSKGL